MRLRKKTHNGIPKFASGGSAGGEILDFQRQYNPFLGDYPTYGMVGSGQPGAWMFFDDAWLRATIPQPPSNVVAPPPAGPPVMGPIDQGPDGGGADRYTDDWRGINVSQAISPDYENLESFAGYNVGEPDYSNLESFAGYNVGEPGKYGSYEDYIGIGYGPSVTTGQPMESAPPAGWGGASVGGYSRAGTGTQEIGGRVWGGNREPLSPTSPPNAGDLFGPPVADQGWPATPDLPELPSEQDYQPASNVFGGPPEYVAPTEEEQAIAGTGTMMGGGINYGPGQGPLNALADFLGFNSAPPDTTGYVSDYAPPDPITGAPAGQHGVSISIDPKAVGEYIGGAAGPGSLVGVNEYVQGQMGVGGAWGSQGMGAMSGFANSPVGQAALGALSGFSGSVSPEAFVAPGDKPGRGFTEKSAYSGMSGLAGPGSSGPVGIGGALGGLAAPSNPGMGAASALAAAMGLTQDMGLGLVPNQPMEPTNTVAGPVGAPVGAPAMDPFAGLTDTQIEALAAGYHDQAPAVGAPSPIAGFETGLAASQAAAERASGRGKGGGDLKGGYSDDMMDSGRGQDNMAAGSSGGVGGGRGMPGIDYTGSSGIVGDKQGATGQDKGDTGDSGQGSGGSEGGNSGGGSGASGSSGTGENAGDEGGVGAWARGGRVKSRGLPSMADQVRRAGRGNDTVLAHITPNEAARFDAMQGGPSFNPETGLREYGFLDDIGDFFGDAAKAVAPIAGGLLGGAFGGPLGAAAGAALGTALTGGSLQQSLLSGAIGGIGAYAGPKISGAAQGMFGGGEETVGGSGGDMLNSGGGTDDLGGGGFFSNFAGNPLAMVGLGAAGGLGAGYLMGGGAGDDDAQSSYQRPTPWVPRPGGLGQRNYQPYQGDYTTYGQVGGGAGHSFYDRVNPPVEYYAEGGRVEPKAPSKERMREVLGRELMDGDDYTNPMAVLQTAQMAMPPKPVQQPGLPAPQLQEPQQLQAPVPPTGQGMMGQWQQGAMPPWLIDRDDQGDQRIANLIWRAPGGAVQGPGTGQSDDIPAMLSDGEYVVSADVVSHLGGGSNNAGADRLDQLMANVRNHRSQGGKGLPPTAKSPMEYMGR